MNRLISAFAFAMTIIGFASVSFAESILLPTDSEFDAMFPEALGDNPYPLSTEVITTLLSSPNVAQFGDRSGWRIKIPEPSPGTIGRWLGIGLYPDLRFEDLPVFDPPRSNPIAQQAEAACYTDFKFANLPAFDPPPATSPEPEVIETDPLFSSAPLIDDLGEVFFEFGNPTNEMIGTFQQANFWNRFELQRLRNAPRLPPPPDLPSFLVHDEFTSATFADAINYFVEMGEQKAIQLLISQTGPANAWGQRLGNRLALVCRVLFEPKDKNALRPPKFGSLGLPYRTMPLTDWPHFPVAYSGSSYFVLADGYDIIGFPESHRDSVLYCNATGKFRKDCVSVPTRVEAERDLDLLLASPEWKAIQWEEIGPGSNYRYINPKGVIANLKSQAENIEPK
ncbi:MAG TPA: hypothetical protein PK402_05550 [Tepidisphaeraceae bacterium]|nr:hypothetical protein [Tepidisphaeraceae bacterium]